MAVKIHKQTLEFDQEHCSAFCSCAFGNGVFLAVQYNSDNRTSDTGLHISPDGLNWRWHATNTQFNQIVFGKGLFIAHDIKEKQTAIRTSTDGINWTKRFDMPVLAWFDLKFCGDKFVVATDRDIMYMSDDGINWTGNGAVMSDKLNPLIRPFYIGYATDVKKYYIISNDRFALRNDLNTGWDLATMNEQENVSFFDEFTYVYDAKRNRQLCILHKSKQFGFVKINHSTNESHIGQDLHNMTKISEAQKRIYDYAEHDTLQHAILLKDNTTANKYTGEIDFFQVREALPMLSVKYPIEVDFGQSTYYTITEASATEPIYKGYSYEVSVDVSPILQRYLNSELVNVPNVGSSTGDIYEVEIDSVIREFTISAYDGSVSHTVSVINDYNDKYVTAYDDTYITSKSITGKYHPQGLVFADVNSPNADATLLLNNESFTNFDTIHLTVKLESDPTDDGILTNIYKIRDIAPQSVFDSIWDGSKYIFCVGELPNVNATGYSLLTNNLTDYNEYSTIINYPYKCAYSGTIYMFVGSNASNSYNMSYSNDAMNFTRYNNQYGNQRLIYVDYDGSRFIALASGNSPFVYISNEGTKWDNASSVNPNATNMIKFAYNGTNRYIFISDVGYTISSNAIYDGTYISMQNSNLNDIIFANNLFIILDLQNRAIYTTTDGESLNTYEISFIPYKIAYGNGIYLVVGANSNYAYSTDLTNWIYGGSLGINTTFYSLKYINNNFVATGSNGYVVTFKNNIGEFDQITVNGELYPVRLTKGCEKYSVYWVNRQGGRSQILCEGKEIIQYTNDFTRFDTNYVRQSPTSFETRTIVNQVTKQWSIFTGRLNDDQSKEMNDLFTSPKVWLHDHETDMIYSVYIPTKTFTEKSFFTDKIYGYEIDLVQAQKHIRR